MDYEKAKRALDALSQERQAQQDRLKKAAETKAKDLDKPSGIAERLSSLSYEVNLAAETKQQLDASRTQLPISNRVL